MNIEIANRFVALRKANGLSQEALAEKLGVSRQAVSKWERAEASPDTDNLILLARIYKISLDELLFSEESPIPGSQTSEAAARPLGEQEKLESSSGIHQESAVSKVSARSKGINDTDFTKQEHVPRNDNTPSPGKHRHSPQFPLALLVSFLYIAIGIFYHIWHPTWLLFLLIPFSSRLPAALLYKDWKLLPYPLVIIATYLVLGISHGSWHTAWVLLLTIPLYYSLIRYFRQRKTTSNS